MTVYIFLRIKIVHITNVTDPLKLLTLHFNSLRKSPLYENVYYSRPRWAQIVLKFPCTEDHWNLV